MRFDRSKLKTDNSRSSSIVFKSMHDGRLIRYQWFRIMKRSGEKQIRQIGGGLDEDYRVFLTSFWLKFQDFRTAKNMVRWIKLFWLFYILILILLKRWTTRKYWNVRKQQFCQLRKLFFTTYFCKRTKFQSDEISINVKK